MIDNLPEAIRKLLIDDATVTALIDKAHINQAPQVISDADDPYVLIMEMDVDNMFHKDCDAPQQSKNLIMIDIYHTKLRTLGEVRKAIKAVLHEYSGTVDGFVIQEMWLHDQQMGREEETKKHIYRDEYYARVINN